MNRDDWWTLERACQETDRKERTLRRWLAEGNIRTEKPRRIQYLYGPDVMAVEAAKTAAIEHPNRTPRSGGTDSPVPTASGAGTDGGHRGILTVNGRSISATG